MTQADPTHVPYVPDLVPLDCHGLRVVQLPRPFDPPIYDLVDPRGSAWEGNIQLTPEGRLTALARGAVE